MDDQELISKLPTWVTALIEVAKQFGIATVICLGMAYGIYQVGLKLVASHENYLNRTAASYDRLADSYDKLIENNKQQTTNQLKNLDLSEKILESHEEATNALKSIDIELKRRT